LFVYVPKGVKDFKIQLTHKLDAQVDALINVRNLIIAEPESEVTIIQCDDSNAH
jgi:Fe-S cluster assembly scaffold protein SufB